MTLTINNVDVVPFIANKGLKWSRNDIDSPDTGRALNGLMYRGRVTSKIRLDVTCRPLRSDEVYTILNLIYPEYVTVTYDDPMLGTVTKTMYSNNNPAVFQMKKNDGSEWWGGVTFPLVER